MRVVRLGVVLAVVLAAVALPSSTTQTPGGCPAHLTAPEEFPALPPRLAPPTLPARPSRVDVCRYDVDGSVYARTSVGGAGGRALAEAMSHPGRQPRAARCRPRLAVVAAFVSPDRPPRRVAIFQEDYSADASALCGGPVGLQGGRVVSVTPGMSEALDDAFGSGLPNLPNRWTPIPSVVGRPLKAAIAAARAAGFATDFAGEIYAPGMRLGRVALQTPFARSHNDVGEGDPRIRVKIAVGNAPRCAAADVEVRYRAASEGTGIVNIGNSGRRVCRLAGGVLLTGIDGSGQPVTPTHRARIPFPAVLPGPLTDDRIEFGIVLSSYPATDPNAPSQDCPASERFAPAAWRVVVPGAGEHTVDNRAGPAYGSVGDPLQTCRGSFGSTELQTG